MFDENTMKKLRWKYVGVPGRTCDGRKRRKMEVYEGGAGEYPLPLLGNGHKFLYFSLAHYKARFPPQLHNISDITANIPHKCEEKLD